MDTEQKKTEKPAEETNYAVKILKDEWLKLAAKEKDAGVETKCSKKLDQLSKAIDSIRNDVVKTDTNKNE